MYYIYKYVNNINNKKYIGQTKDPEQRKRNHKSEAYNSRSQGYNLPFHAAIRKYGWENFSYEIIEEIPEEFGHEYVDERERFFICFFHAQVNENKGYNVCLGGQGNPRPKLNFEEQVKCSKMFTEKEIRDIQQMLIENYQYYEIQKKYPKLTKSFLSNINCGYNFIRSDLTYPLTIYHTKFAKETQEEIIQKIIQGIKYSEISALYGVSPSYISMINNGQKWHRKDLSYPLCKKSCADGAWSHEAKYLLIFTSLSHLEIGQKVNKSKSAITALNVGRNRKDKRFLYPLRTYQMENKKIWNTLF